MNADLLDVPEVIRADIADKIGPSILYGCGLGVWETVPTLSIPTGFNGMWQWGQS